MSFWTDPSLEPKRGFKFTLSIAGGASSPAVAIPKFLIKKVSKPSFTISESEHKFLNHSFWYPGKVAWNEVAFTVVDVIGESDGTAKLMQMFENAGYRAPENLDAGGALQTISKKRSVAALGDVIIEQLNSEGETVDKWRLKNAWFKDVKFGDLDYDTEDMLNVEVSLRYDYAVYKGGAEFKEIFPTNAKDQMS